MLTLGTVIAGCALVVLTSAPLYVVFLGALLVQGATAGVFHYGSGRALWTAGFVAGRFRLTVVSLWLRIGTPDGPRLETIAV